MEPLTHLSVSALAQAIRERRVSSREVIEAYVQRIEEVNPRLNVVAQLSADSAHRQAMEADEAMMRGEVRGPLHGVPFTVKDWIETKGLVCAAGTQERREFVPKRDATVVARLREAGAVLLGKTVDNVVNPIYGKPGNPYDPERSPGGSSSGEAAIIAAGGSALGVGSDSGGSIRLPAHYCGIAGLKPSAGRVPTTGHFPRISALSDPRTQVGPMARFVEDLELVLPLIAGADGLDTGVVPVPLGRAEEVALGRLRVATYVEYEGTSATQEVKAAVRAAAQVLEDAGAFVEEALPPRIEEAWTITQVHWARTRSYSWSEWLIEKDAELSAAVIERSIFECDRLRRAFLGFMQRYDLIVCPVAGDTAPPRGEESPRDCVYTLPYSLTGQPCSVVRAGTSGSGLPIGVQLVARLWRDDVALAAAGQIERALGGWRPEGA